MNQPTNRLTLGQLDKMVKDEGCDWLASKRQLARQCAELMRENAELREALSRAKIQHFICEEDPHYRCQTYDYPDRQCNCETGEHNVAIDRVLTNTTTLSTPSLESETKEPQE